MVQTTPPTQVSRYKRLCAYLAKINLFDDKESLSLVDELLATRIFFFTFLIILTIIIGFTVLNVQTETVTIQSPSQTRFEQLSSHYPNTLSCPCTQTSVRQDHFLSFKPQYHPICTSQFVSQSFISSLTDVNMSNYLSLDYRVMAASHFQILSSLCQTIEQMLTDSLQEFASDYVTTTRVHSHDAFDAQTQQLIQQIKTTTVANIKHTHDFIWLNIYQNRIYSGLRSNYISQIVPQFTSPFHITGHYSISNDSCGCDLNVACIQQAGIFGPVQWTVVNASSVLQIIASSHASSLFIIPGIMAGCLPYSSLLQSSFTCFYNQSCIQKLQTFIHGFSFISPFSSSSSSRFQHNTTVSDLLDELFIESWNEHSNFTGYFQECSPHSCTYSYDRQFNLLYTIVTLISFLGGIRVVLFFCTPLMVKIIRRFQKCNCCSKTTNEAAVDTEAHPRQSMKDRFVTIVHNAKLNITTLNIFPSSSDVTNGLYSTRIYLVLFFIGIIILIFYSAISVQLRTVTVNHPSLSDYEQLYRRYSSSIECPCTLYSVSYSSIMYIEPRYHQVCSSDFIRDDRWLLYFSPLSGALSGFDFRTSGHALFFTLQTLCRMSEETVTNELTVFNNMQFVSTRILPNETFKTQTSIFIRQFQQQTIDSFLGLLELVRTSIQLNTFIIQGDTTVKLSSIAINNSRSWRYIPTGNYDNDCSCVKSISCTRAQGFYCTSTHCTSSGDRPTQTVPGLVLGCLSVDSLLASSLQCFYNKTCIQMLVQWYAFGLNSFKIDLRAANVTPLDLRSHSRFSPYTKMNEIVSQLFIEDWTSSTDFSSYYRQCAPDQCTYTYEQRLNKTYIFAVLFGIVGGLSVTLRILIPPVFKIFRRIYHHYFRRRANTTREVFIEAGIHRTFSHYIIQLWHSIKTLNLYKKVQETNVNEQTQRQRIATRFYVILFLLALITIINFTILTSQINSTTVSSPSQSTYASLRVQYSSTLSCPCSQTATQYSKFVSVQPATYHQICSSVFISSNFTNLLWGSDDGSTFFANMDGKILSIHFRLLSSFCSLATNVIAQRTTMFSSRKLISLEPLTQQSFQAQIDSIISTFILQTPASFRRTHQYINEMLHANQLHNFFYTNWDLRPSTANDGYLMLTSPISYNESGQSCSCATSSTCSRSLMLNGNKQDKFAGLVCGCIPIYGVRLSTLACLYNSTCLKRLAAFVSSSYVPSPLSISNHTRFTPISSVTIGTLIDELFIETWQNTSNYSAYFSNCAPLTCQYTYMERHNALYVLTTFLGLYGGLTEELKFIVWYMFVLYWKLCRWVRNCRRKVEPLNNNE